MILKGCCEAALFNLRGPLTKVYASWFFVKVDRKQTQKLFLVLTTKIWSIVFHVEHKWSEEGSLAKPSERSAMKAKPTLR